MKEEVKKKNNQIIIAIFTKLVKQTWMKVFMNPYENF